MAPATSRSIWHGLSRATFEDHVDAYHRTAFIPPREPPVVASSRSGNALLPLDIENQLADDLAFIAACEHGVSYVTAVCIESPPIQDAAGLTIRLSANEGVCARAKEHIERVLKTLERCSAKEISRGDCAETVFDIIVKLNRNRILGRLASRHFRRLSCGPSVRDPLPYRFSKNVATHASQRRQSPRSKVDYENLSLQMKEFDESLSKLNSLERRNSDDTIHAIKDTVKAAFRITVDGYALIHRLNALGMPSKITDSRAIHDVNKVAIYWRICPFLAHISRVYRPQFSTLKLETVDPYPPFPSARPQAGTKRHVHAEVQMVVYYENSSLPPDRWPRVIGASKEACFLCHAFIKNHGCFGLSKAHLQMYRQWTVPDLTNYSDESLDRLRHSLRAIDKIIVVKLNKMKKKRQASRPLPMQSSANLEMAALPPCSVTTVHSSGSDLSTCTVQPPHTTLSPKPAPSPSPQELSNAPSILSASPSPRAEMSTVNEVPEELSDGSTGTITKSPTTSVSSHPIHQIVPGSCATISFSSVGYAELDWIHVHVHLDDLSSPQKREPTPSVTPQPSGSVRLEALPCGDTLTGREKLGRCVTWLDVNDLAPGEERVLRTPGDKSVEDMLELVLTNGPRRVPIRVVCKYNGTGSAYA